jgi:hypothetical protein
MDREPELLLQFYRIAYQLVNWLLHVLLFFGAVIAGYYIWMFTGQFGLIFYVACVGMLRLAGDIRRINRGEYDVPKHWKAKMPETDELKTPDHPFRKSGR